MFFFFFTNFHFSCDYNKYSLQYILSLAENKRKKPAVTEISHLDSDSDEDNLELMQQSDSGNDETELLMADSDMDT